MSLTPIQIGRNLWTCAQECPFRQKEPYGGVALCSRNRRDHRINAERGDCPEGRFSPAQEKKPAALPPQGKSVDQKREVCQANACASFRGFLETICGLEEAGPEIVSCASCPCPLKKVNLRTGRCPRRLW